MELYQIVIFVGLISAFRCHDLKRFEDSVLYNLDWPGNSPVEFDPEKFESMVVTTSDQEKYRCIIPFVDNKEDDEKSKYTNLSPLNFLSVIFSASACSFRLEAYWTYEICHGHHMRQFHDEREGKNTKTQEYYLGRWDETKMAKLNEKVLEDMQTGRKYKHTKIDNIKYPYFEMEMTDGTLCDLNNEPRITRVRYVCYPQGKNEIYSLKETSTCNYEAIILTSALCMHPAFSPEDSLETTINCLPIDDSPDKPFSWLVNKVDDMKMRYKQISEVFRPKENIAIIKVDPKDGILRMDIINADLLDEKFTSPEPTDQEDVSPATNSPQPTSSPVNDEQSIIDLLKGVKCMAGGNGWWKHEFCYGKSVLQYHETRISTETLVLGYFDEKLHKQWLRNNPEKRPAPKNIRTDITHWFQGGTYCEKTGEKRQVEVKMKCGYPANVPHVLYLLEPKTCQYILVVESPKICKILPFVDEDGLVPKNSALYAVRDEKSNDKKSKGVHIENIVVEDVEVRYEND